MLETRYWMLDGFGLRHCVIPSTFGVRHSSLLPHSSPGKCHRSSDFLAEKSALTVIRLRPAVAGLRRDRERSRAHFASPGSADTRPRGPGQGCWGKTFETVQYI